MSAPSPQRPERVIHPAVIAAAGIIGYSAAKGVALAKEQQREIERVILGVEDPNDRAVAILEISQFALFLKERHKAVETARSLLSILNNLARPVVEAVRAQSAPPDDDETTQPGVPTPQPPARAASRAASTPPAPARPAPARPAPSPSGGRSSDGSDGFEG